MTHHRHLLFWNGWLSAVLLFGSLVSGGVAADKAEIKESIERAKKFLLGQSKTGPTGSLACYALIKSGVEASHPDIQKCVQEVLGKCRTTGYVPQLHHNYEAGVDAMLLEAVDREEYRPQLQLIANYLISRQRPHGGWYYPIEVGSNDYGDTSITQYAVLGLWAASRAGVEVPVETWQKVAKWLIQTQALDGGFGYHPQEASVQGLFSTCPMTAAGTGTLLVVRFVLFNETAYDEEVRPAAAPRRYGPLERLAEEKEKTPKPKPKSSPTIAATAFDKTLKEGVRWSADHFGEKQLVMNYENYYLYGIERMAALLDVEKIGDHDWYNEGADILLKSQAANGSWSDSCGVIASTSLTLLFLTKATATIVHKPKPKAPKVGGGLLIGGRGLPENLDAVAVKEGEVVKRKLHGSVDGLLSELEKSTDAKVEEVQEAVVETVQLDRPEDLIIQVDRLKRLADDKRVEIRRTAMWALGRTGNVSVAPYLIRGLSDVDESVVREASAGLCILSRRPNGCGLPPDPAEGLNESASDDERASYLREWKTNCTKLWSEWYLKVRPYDERDDRNALKRKP